MALNWVEFGDYLFEKRLSETDTKHRLAFPVQQLHHFINPADQPPQITPMEFWVEDGRGDPFLLRLSIRRDHQGHPKPEITGDWLDFIRDKDLKPYDRVIFYKNPVSIYSKNKGVLFTIAVRRAVRVFGAVFGYAELIE